MPTNRTETGYDKLALSRANTEQFIRDNTALMKPWELTFAKDANKVFFKDDANVLHSIVGANVQDLTDEANRQIVILQAESVKQVGIVTAEGDHQASRLANLGPDGIKQLPLDSIYGSISAKNGRLYTSGAFNHIHGIENANVLEYGDSKIITTPDNSFNAIVESDKLYVGPGYKNLATEQNNNGDGWTARTGATLIKTDNNEWYNLKGTTPQDTTLFLQCLQENMVSKNIISTITIKNNSPRKFKIDIRNSTTITIGRGEVSVIKLSSPNSNTLADRFYIYANSSVELGVDYDLDIKKNFQVVEGAEEKPFIPPQYTFPNGVLSLKVDRKLVDLTSLQKGDNLVDTTQSGDYISLSGNTELSQSLIYFPKITSQEETKELAKNLYIEGEVDVISQIQTDMKVGAILGKRPQGDIDDGTLHKVDEIWYSNKLGKYYECITGNSDNYVDTNKWKERSLMSAPYISISGYKVEVV